MKCGNQVSMKEDGEALGEGLFVRFTEADRAISRSAGQLLNRRFGISLAQAKAITYLARQQFVTIGQLAHRLNHDLGAVSRLISRLVMSEYVVKMRQTADRRCYCIALTERGVEMAVKIIAALEEVEDELCIGLTNEEVRRLTTLLKRVIVNAKPHRNDIAIQATA